MRASGFARLYVGFRVCIGTSLAILRRFWVVAARVNSSRAPFGPRNRSRSSLRMRLRCANSVSLTEPTRGAFLPRPCDLACHVASALIDRAPHLPRCLLGASSGLGRIDRNRACWRRKASLRHRSPAFRCEDLAAGTTVDVTRVVIDEALARECPVRASRLVEHRNVWLDPVLVHQPAEHFGRPYPCRRKAVSD
jgi:hypothetical protein